MGLSLAEVQSMRNLIVSILMCSALLGCGGGDGGSSYTPDNSSALSDGETLARKFYVSCGIGNDLDCQSVALFVQAISYSSYSSCSSFIAGEIEGKTVMATNIHCLEGVTRDDECREKIAFSFARVGRYTSETASCGRILKVSPHNSKLDPDFAFLLLNKKIDRPNLKLSVQGVKNDENLSVIHFDTDLVRYSSTINKTDCKSVMGSTFNLAYTSETSPTLALYGCRLQHGNSGSAILNANGEVSAILQAGAADEEQIETQKMFDSSLRDYTKNVDLTLVNIATNLACIEYPEIGLVLKSGNLCQQKADSYSAQSFNGTQKEAIRKIEREMRAWVTDKNLIVFPQFNIDRTARGQKVMSISSGPLCFMPPSPNNEWLKKYKRRYWFGYSSEANELVSFKMWAVNMEVDELGRLKTSVESGEKYVSIKFNPNDLVKNGSSESSIYDSTSSFSGIQRSVDSNWLSRKVFGGLFQSRTTLSFCTEAQVREALRSQ